MGIGTPLSNESNEQSKKCRRRRKKSPNRGKQLFLTCKDVFANAATGVVPSPEKIEELRAVLDRMTPEDLGVTPEMSPFRTSADRRVPAIGYQHIFENEKFFMGIFCLPPGGVIPLHNHPGMTVFSKLLFGTMHIKSYDWVIDPPCKAMANSNFSEVQPSQVKLARVKVDANFTAPCNASILYPADGGNMHCFTAITACAVLDVLGPPYSDPAGRHCQYYLDFPFDNFSVDGFAVADEEKKGYAWLQEREKPEDLAVIGARYGGPKIVDE